MITRLYLDKFYKHQDRTFTFETGLTGITGPNESGKSLITEGVRYALFGSAALRATAPKDLHVELDFVIGGETYTVVRKGSQARLGDLAIGIKPVNAAIIKLLGYDLQVFDVANSCNQGSVEALSDMRPAERKAMVDRTVGLDTLDAVLKYLGERGNALKSQALGMRAALTVPVAPTVYEGYRPSAEIAPLISAASADIRERNQILGFLQAAPPVPAGAKGRSADELRPLRAAAADQAAELAELTRYLTAAPARPAAPEACLVDRSADELEKQETIRLADARRRLELQNKLAALELPAYLDAELEAFEAQHQAAALWDQRQKLLAQGHLCCPACNHTWPVAGNIPDAVETAAPSVSLAEISRQRGLRGNSQEYIDLEWALEALVVMDDRSAQLNARRAYEAHLAAYERAQAAYDSYHQGVEAKCTRHVELSALPDQRGALDLELALANQWGTYDAFEVEAGPKRLRLLELQGCEDDLSELQAQLNMARAYEQDVARFGAAKEAYDLKLVELSEISEKSEVYLKARMDVFDLKTKVKSYLLPSLNKVASHLIGQMTGGARHSVVVDDDFEILVDGNPIGTLSGSGKAVANLSIRIALGQILTNRVFSLFMADEVDGSMDADRADYVATALQRLTGMVKQVILITHKNPETDHRIELHK